MARPGVREGRIRRKRDGIRGLRKAIGHTTFAGISVRGHCLGIQARAWRLPAQPANYPYALDAAHAVQKAGKMRQGKPRRGALIWWSTGSGYPGHVATVVGVRRDHVLSNVGSTIQRVPISYFGSFRCLGWCYPGDVPGWVPAGK